MSTIIDEKEVDIAVVSIYVSLFCFDRMAIVGFLNSKRKFVTINDPLNQSYNISPFIFCSTINPHIVDLRVPDTVYTFELSLCLPLPLDTLPTDIVATKPLCSSHT